MLPWRRVYFVYRPQLRDCMRPTIPLRTSGSDEIRPTIDIAWLAAMAFITALVACIWFVSGVSLRDAASYLGYFALFVALPGIAACLLVRRPRRLNLEHICIGVPLGFTLVILGFILCSSLGLRRLSPYISPLLGAAAITVQIVRRTLPAVRFHRSPRFRREILILVAVAAAVILLEASEFFPLYPLPDKLLPTGVDYQTDIPWHIGNAAGIKSFWPPEDLRAVGVPMRYYLGVHIHAAVASLVTGVEVSTIFLRLDLPLFVSLLALQLYWLGREVSGRSAGGLLTAGVALLAADLSILRGSTATLYYNLFVRNLFLSPSYALGLLLFVPLVVSIGRYIADDTEDRSYLVVTALLSVCLCWVKLPAIPVLAAGCAGVAFETFVRTRQAPKRPLIALAIVALSLAATWRFVVMPKGDGYLRLAPFFTFLRIPAYRSLFGGVAGGALTAPLRALATVLGYAPVAVGGLVACVIYRRLKDNVFARWLLMVMLAGAGASLMFDGAGVGQLWFLLYGYVGLSALSAVGVLAILSRWSARPRPVIALSAGLVALAAVGSSVARAYPGFLVAVGRSQVTPGRLTPDRAEAYRWVRSSSAADAIVAIDQFQDVYASALSERRFLLENDSFSQSAYLYRFTQGRGGSPPNQELRELTRRMFEQGDAAAIREARDRYGVRYLIHDRDLSPAMKVIDASIAKLVFANTTVAVYEVLR